LILRTVGIMRRTSRWFFDPTIFLMMKLIMLCLPRARTTRKVPEYLQRATGKRLSWSEDNEGNKERWATLSGSKKGARRRPFVNPLLLA
jgi:hypothetical protein